MKYKIAVEYMILVWLNKHQLSLIALINLINLDLGRKCDFTVIMILLKLYLFGRINYFTAFTIEGRKAVIYLTRRGHKYASDLKIKQRRYQ
jgi:hypothetical protein